MLDIQKRVLTHLSTGSQERLNALMDLTERGVFEQPAREPSIVAKINDYLKENPRKFCSGGIDRFKKAVFPVEHPEWLMEWAYGTTHGKKGNPEISIGFMSGIIDTHYFAFAPNGKDNLRGGKNYAPMNDPFNRNWWGFEPERIIDGATGKDVEKPLPEWLVEWGKGKPGGVPKSLEDTRDKLYAFYADGSRDWSNTKLNNKEPWERGWVTTPVRIVDGNTGKDIPKPKTNRELAIERLAKDGHTHPKNIWKQDTHIGLMADGEGCYGSSLDEVTGKLQKHLSYKNREVKYILELDTNTKYLPKTIWEPVKE